MWNQQGGEPYGGQSGYGQQHEAAPMGSAAAEQRGGYDGSYGEYGYHGDNRPSGGYAGKPSGYGGEYGNGARPSERGSGEGVYPDHVAAYGHDGVNYGAHQDQAPSAHAYGQQDAYYGEPRSGYAGNNGDVQHEHYIPHLQPPSGQAHPVSHEYSNPIQATAYDGSGVAQVANFEPQAYQQLNAPSISESDGKLGRAPFQHNRMLSGHEPTRAGLDNVADAKKMESNGVQKPEPEMQPQFQPVSKATPAVAKPPLMAIKKNPSNVKGAGPRLAFGFKSASKVKATINPLKAALETDEIERQEAERKEEAERDAKRQKLGIAPPVAENRAPPAPPPAPEDPEVQRIAEKLAKFVAKNGRGLENTTRQRNPGDTPFRFLFDPASRDYKYYDHCVGLEEAAIREADAAAQGQRDGSQPTQAPITQPLPQPVERRRAGFSDAPPASRPEPSGVASNHGDKLSQEDSLAKMEFYARQAARANAAKEPRENSREMPPPDGDRDAIVAGRRGHHMGDFIPEDELNRFMAKVTPGEQVPVREDRNKIGAGNVGHKLLSKMGWTEGSGLGAGGSGMIDPLAAGGAKLDGLGVGAAQTHEPTTSDDIYEQYKKRMMLGYKHRPNPLGNPRKAYY